MSVPLKVGGLIVLLDLEEGKDDLHARLSHPPRSASFLLGRIFVVGLGGVAGLAMCGAMLDMGVRAATSIVYFNFRFGTSRIG